MWLLTALAAACLAKVGTATSLQQCNGVGTIPVSRNEPYNVTCDITETTRNVTWTFLSLLTGDTDVVVNDCLLISANRESSSCRSKVPYFTIHRPHYAYTSLEIVWDQLPEKKTYGKIMCSLDGRPPESCYLVINVTAAPSSTVRPQTLVPTSPATATNSTTAVSTTTPTTTSTTTIPIASGTTTAITESTPTPTPTTTRPSTTLTSTSTTAPTATTVTPTATPPTGPRTTTKTTQPTTTTTPTTTSTTTTALPTTATTKTTTMSTTTTPITTTTTLSTTTKATTPTTTITPTASSSTTTSTTPTATTADTTTTTTLTPPTSPKDTTTTSTTRTTSRTTTTTSMPRSTTKTTTTTTTATTTRTSESPGITNDSSEAPVSSSPPTTTSTLSSVSHNDTVTTTMESSSSLEPSSETNSSIAPLPERTTSTRTTTTATTTTTTATTPAGDRRTPAGGAATGSAGGTEEERLSIAAIIGSSVAVVTVVPALAVGVVVFLLWRRRKRRSASVFKETGSLEFYNSSYINTNTLRSFPSSSWRKTHTVSRHCFPAPFPADPAPFPTDPAPLSFVRNSDYATVGDLEFSHTNASSDDATAHGFNYVIGGDASDFDPYSRTDRSRGRPDRRSRRAPEGGGDYDRIGNTARTAPAPNKAAGDWTVGSGSLSTVTVEDCPYAGVAKGGQRATSTTSWNATGPRAGDGGSMKSEALYLTGVLGLRSSLAASQPLPRFHGDNGSLNHSARAEPAPDGDVDSSREQFPKHTML